MVAARSIDIFGTSNEALFARSVLVKFDRAKILEAYFARIDAREPNLTLAESLEISSIDTEYIRSFLLNQWSQDSVLQQVVRMMN